MTATALPPFISIESISKSFHKDGKQIPVISDFSLDARQGEFVVLFGPNGCGKTTLLHVLAGLDSSFKGKIVVGGKEGGYLSTGFVFQNFHESLFPYKTILENVEFPLLAKGVGGKACAQAAHSWLSKVGLSDHAGKYPYELSGGMKQLTALARAWVSDPSLLILDEPFSSLDYDTRLKMEEQVQKLWGENPKTTIFVSHDVDEAVFLADKVVVLTKRPARVKKIIEVNLPRPRTKTTRLSKEFFELRNQVIKAFQEGE